MSEHVLVVDPAREEQAQLRSYLETAGYRVSTADSGEPALRAFEQAPADVVLLDVVAPAFEAFATCKRLRQLPSGLQAAIVCLTPDSASQDQALAAGADDCLTKPLESPELLQRVRSLLRFKHLAEDLAREKEALRVERDELLGAQKRRDETIALVVHDMKNPLAGVLSNAEYLVSSNGLSMDQNECATDILGAARRLHRQMMSLLDVNLRDHGALSPAPVAFELVEAIEIVLAGGAPLMADKLLRCEITGEPAPLPVRADRDMIARLIENLFENAVRSSPHAGVVTFELSRTAEIVEIKVTDRGPRLASEYRAQLFETYVRADEPVRRARKGRGLGLASCRAIAEAHGGSIRLEDAQPEGSTFRVAMPIGPKLKSSS